MKFYIQQKNNQWLNTACYAIWYACNERGIEYSAFTFDNLISNSLNLSKETVVCGGIKSVLMALEKIGARAPENIDLPSSLTDFYKRKIWTSHLGNIRSIEKFEKPLHIKPLYGHKLFNGSVIRSTKDLLTLTNVPSETEIIVQEYIEMLSEYRFYILNKEIIGVGFYNGNPVFMPDTSIVTNAIYSFINSPIAYSIDVAVTNNNDTIVIEVNDAFSLGFYGLNPFKYCDMVEARWKEMTMA